MTSENLTGHEKWTERSNESFKTGREGRLGSGFERYEWFFKHMKPNSKILEIGFNSGRALGYLADEGHECTGIDLPLVVKNIKAPHPDITYISMSIDTPNGRALSWMFDKDFDYVICGEVLQHIVYDENLLFAIWHWLKVGGKLLMSTENTKVVYHAFRYYTDIGLKRLLSVLDYRIEDITTEEHSGYVWVSAVKKDLNAQKLARDAARSRYVDRKP